jgi:hypothetical protein
MIDKERSRKIRVELRKVLMEQWDPIGVNGVFEASDEYDSYIGGVYGLLSRKVSDQELASHLRKIETQRMGLDQLDASRLPKVARELREAFERCIKEKGGDETKETYTLLTDHLLPKLNLSFPSRTFACDSEGGTVTFPARHPEVGDVVVRDDVDEITIILGNFTHSHFGCYDSTISSAERMERIAEDVVGFLRDLFEDRIELFGSHRRGGCCRPRRSKLRSWLSRFWYGKRTFVWSGPLS